LNTLATKHSPNPLPEHHPRAYRAYQFLGSCGIFCLHAVVFGPLLILLSCFIVATGAIGLSQAIMALGGLVIVLFSVLAAGAFILRFAIIALCFTRYSLLHLVGIVFAINCLVSLHFILPESLKAIPLILGAWLVMAVFVFIFCQDPDDPDPTPQFIQNSLPKTQRHSS
jgi:hypothetical protein